MKRIICFILIVSSLLFAAGCNERQNEGKNELDASLSLIMSEMELSEDEAFAALEILCDLGLDAEIEYIYPDESGGETFYKVWYGLHLMKVYLNEGRIEKVIKNQQQIYPADETDDKPSASASGTTNGTSSESKKDPTSTSAGELDIQIVSLTSPVKAGGRATLEIQGEPDTEYAITVRYSSGASSASGLEPKISDADGRVSWTWKVGGSVKPGKYTITVSSGNNSFTTEFEVEAKVQ